MASVNNSILNYEDEGSFPVNKSNWLKQNIPKAKRLESKFLHRINLGGIYDNKGNKLKMSLSMKQSIDRTETQAHESRKIRKKDKKDRATTEMVLDHRTKTILYQMLSKGLIDNIYGCISTGKEANVYYCNNKENKEFALKVYKTSILSFKDRARYIRGEHRFDKGYSKNPRKMVQLWAEKEFRNLHRIYASNIASPKPIYVRQNVLLMNIIGYNGIAAPRLKDYKFIDNNQIYKCYLQIIKYMRLMYWKCNLIHADLSEYNILYWNNLPYIIDVSQSVEPSHPNSYQFLAIDCKNINDYFRKCAIMTLTDLELFEYILDERHIKNMNNINLKLKLNNNKKNNEKNKIFLIHCDQWNDVIDIKLLNKIENICKERWNKCVNINENQVRDSIQINSKIMRSLFDIDNAFEIRENKDQITKFLLKDSGEMININKLNDESVDLKINYEDDQSDDLNKNKNENKNKEIQVVMGPENPCDALYHKHTMTKPELKQIRKANKKIVKASNRERRKHKMPKKVKKRKIKVARLKAGKTVWKG